MLAKLVIIFAWLQFFGANSVELCNPSQLKFGSINVKIIPRPKGFCKNCCKLDIKNDIRLFLYTKDNPEDGILLRKYKTGIVAKAGLKPNQPTIVYIHGFMEFSPEGESSLEIRKAFLSRPEWYNVIIVDWSNLAAAPWYLQAVESTRIVAKILADFLKVSVASGEIQLKSLHLIGFSLGAHVAGFTSKIVKLQLSRITGLDPAFPLFPLNDPNNRLSESDADFVDIIHTNTRALGFPASIGHADFYPNYGHFYQPGCSSEALASRNRFEEILSCSHIRAWRFYAESIRNESSFPASKCKDFSARNKSCDFNVDAYMGYGVSTEANGDYYLSTNGNQPFHTN